MPLYDGLVQAVPAAHVKHVVAPRPEKDWPTTHIEHSARDTDPIKVE